MAKEVEHKLAVAHRPTTSLATSTGCRRRISSSTHDLRSAPAARTTQARPQHWGNRGDLPGDARCQIILGVEHLLRAEPAARHVLNSVFLDHALRRGRWRHRAFLADHAVAQDRREVRVAEDLIFDRQREATTRYGLISRCSGTARSRRVRRGKAEKLEDRLAQRIVDGDRQGSAPISIWRWNVRRSTSSTTSCSTA